MHCLYRFLVTAVCVGNLVFIPVLFCAPSVIYVHTEPIILSSCSNKSSFDSAALSPTETADAFCFQQRRALFLFAVFNLVRILSFNFESLWLNSLKDCSIREALPGVHLSGALAVPFVTRELCEPYMSGYGAHFIFMSTNGICSLLLIVPYIRDLLALVRLTMNGVEHEFYKTKFHLMVTLAALLCYLLTLVVNVLDMAFGPYRPMEILGYPVVFPYINFPLFLFGLHHCVLRTHKENDRMTYELLNDDIYVYVVSHQCLSLVNCSHRSNVYTIAMRPSLAARNSAVTIKGKVARIDSFRNLDAWLQHKMHMAIPPADDKNIYY